MDNYMDPRLETALRLERFALAARYLAYFILVPLFLLGLIYGSMRDLVVVTIALIMHNFFVHMVLWTRRYHLLQSKWNFFIHLIVMSLVVSFTGAEESELYIVYFFFLIGYSVYSNEFGQILLVTGVVMAAYGVVIGLEWLFVGIRMEAGTIVLKFVCIAVCGWLVATLSDLLRRAEDASAARARALASSEATLRTILDSAADPILVYDGDECITLANNKACEFLGMSRGELLGKRFRTLLFDDGSLPDTLKAIEQGGTHKGEQIFVRTDGQERSAEMHVRSFIRDWRHFFVVVAHDITEQKNLQEAAHLANIHLNRLNRELQQVNELKTGMLKSLSQRIRSPLTALRGYIDMLLNEELGQVQPEQRKALQTCRRSTERVFKLIDEVFNIRLVELGREISAGKSRDTA